MGLTRAAEEALRDAGVDLTVFEDVVADPPSAVIETAAETARAKGIELVLSIGGGSALDTAKLVPILQNQAIASRTSTALVSPRLTVCPSSSCRQPRGPARGDSDFHRDDSDDREKGVVSPRLLPDWAILDPELTLGLPAHVTAATGIDAMVHAIEAYTSRHKKNPMSDQLARQALALLSANIRTACREGRNLEARSNMLLGSMLAGMAFANAPVAAVHALAYPIGAIFHVPHGLSNALVLMGVMRFNLLHAEPLYAELAPILDPSAANLSMGKPAAVSSKASQRSVVIAVYRRLRRGWGRRKGLEAPRRRRDETDAPPREQPARGHLRGRLRHLLRGTRRQAPRGGLAVEAIGTEEEPSWTRSTR